MPELVFEIKETFLEKKGIDHAEAQIQSMLNPEGRNIDN